MEIAVNQIIPIETDAVETNNGGATCLELLPDTISLLAEYFIDVTCSVHFLFSSYSLSHSADFSPPLRYLS